MGFSSAITVIEKTSDGSKILIASKTYMALLSEQANGTYVVELNNVIKTDFLPKVNNTTLDWKLDKTEPDLGVSLSFNSLVLRYSAEQGNDVVLTADVIFEETKVTAVIVTNNFSEETFVADQSFDFGVPFGSAFTVFTPMSRDESELLSQKLVSFSDSKYGIGGNNILLRFNEFPSALIGKRGDDFVVYSPYNIKWDQKVESNRFSSLNLEFSPAYVVPKRQYWPNFIVDPNESLTPWLLVDRGVITKKENTENLVNLVRTIIANTKDKNEIVDSVLQRIRIASTHTKKDSLINQNIADVSVVLKSGGTKLEKAYAMREIMHAVGLPSKMIIGTYDRSREYFVAVFTDRWIYIDVARGMKVSRSEFTEIFSEQDVPVYSSIFDVDSMTLLVFSVAPFAAMSIIVLLILFHFRSFIPLGRKRGEITWKEDVLHPDYIIEEKPRPFSRIMGSVNAITEKINSFSGKLPLSRSEKTGFQVQEPAQTSASPQVPAGGQGTAGSAGARYFVIKYSLGSVPYDFLEPIENIIGKYISLHNDFDLKKCSRESGFSEELVKSTLEKMIESMSVKREKVLVDNPVVREESDDLESNPDNPERDSDNPPERKAGNSQPANETAAQADKTVEGKE